MHQYLLLRSRQTENAYGQYAAEVLISEGLSGFTAVGMDTAGLPNLRFHDLRHTAASLLIAEGEKRRVVLGLLEPLRRDAP